MECDDRIACSKLGQITCGLGHLCLDNVDGLLTYRYILYVERFEVLGSFPFAFVTHFTQQVRHLITHNAATTHVGVDEQGPFAGFHYSSKRSVHVGEPPVTRH